MITSTLSVLGQHTDLKKNKNPVYVLIALVQLEVQGFEWFSKIIICQISHMSIHIQQSSKGIYSLC